jgi:hypothetical protein
MTKPSVGRIDDIIRQLQRLHADAQDIMDAHVEYLHCLSPHLPFGTLKLHAIAKPAGSRLDYIEALKIVRKGILSEAA